MHFVLASSIAVLLGAIVGSLLLLRRSGDPRAALLTAVFALLAGTEGLALWSLGPRPLGLDVPTLASLLALATSLVCPFTVLAVARTLRERDRSESLHWSSMETVRELADLTALSSLDLDARLGRLLEIGCTQFGLDVGIVSRIHAERYEVRAIRAPGDFPVRRGAVFPLDATWCRMALESARPVDVAKVSASGWAGHAARSAFPFEAYLAVAIRPGGELRGTLAFASLAPRRERFTATEKDLLTLMGRWLGAELERRDAAPPQRGLSSGWETRPVSEGPEPAPAPRPRAAGKGSGPLDVNDVLRRLERRLRRATGPRATLRLTLAADLESARRLRFPLDAVVLSLVAHAAEALRDGGELEVATGNLEVSASEGALPAVAPDRYVTISVSVSGAAADTDALARAFDAPASEGELAGPGQRLPLPTLYRLLQRCGGDLSIDVERARGASFTVFLPRAAVTPAAAPEATVAGPPLG